MPWGNSRSECDVRFLRLATGRHCQPPELGRPVGACGGQGTAVAVGSERERGDGTVVGLHGHAVRPRGKVPDRHVASEVPGDEGRAVGSEGERMDGFLAIEGGLLVEVGRVPELDRPVIAAGGQLAPTAAARVLPSGANARLLGRSGNSETVRSS